MTRAKTTPPGWIDAAGRAQDDAVLEMLHMRRRTPTPAIGAYFGTTASAIRVATDRVMKDDMAEDGRNLRAEYGFLTKAQAMRRYEGSRA